MALGEMTESELIKTFQNWKATPHEKALLMSSIPEIVATRNHEKKDRAELVLPPPPGWRPENAKRKLKLTLIPEKTMIRKGEEFRYRLEVQNTGQEPIRFYHDYRAFIKTGDLLSGDYYEFYATTPGGPEQKLLSRSQASGGIMPLHEIFFPDSMTIAQKDAALLRMSAEANAASVISLTLGPGETMLSRPYPAPPNRFRDLGALLRFNQPGTYRIKLVFDDLGEHPDVKEEKQFSLQAKNWKISLRDVYKLDARAKLELGISREQQKKDRQEAIQNHEKRRLTAVGRTESNTVLLEVTP